MNLCILHLTNITLSGISPKVVQNLIRQISFTDLGDGKSSPPSLNYASSD